MTPAGLVLTLDEALAWRMAAARQGQRIVLTNGCFDLLHIGHVRCLVAGRALGDCLLVGVNSDLSVTELKGTGRPLVAERERAALLVALRVVDAVTIFHEPTAVQLVEALRPDIYFKGADYAGSGSDRVDEGRLPEAAAVRRGGGVVHLVPTVPGVSTSALIARMAAAAGRQ